MQKHTEPSQDLALLDSGIIASLSVQHHVDHPPMITRLVALYVPKACADIEGALEAIARVDFSAVAEFSHALKGSSLQIGATAFAAVVCTAEQASKSGETETMNAALEALDEGLSELAAALEVRADSCQSS